MPEFGSEEEQAELAGIYRKVIASGFEEGQGEAPHPDLDAAALESIAGEAEGLADQLQRSILDAPWVRSDVLNMVGDWLGQEGDLNLNDLRASLETVFGAPRALMIARSEVGQVFNSAAASAMKAHGFSHIVWIAAPDACEECQALDGTVMSIEEYEGDPTVHPNCSCTAMPAELDEEELANVD